MKKYVDLVVLLAIFVTKLATPALGCETDSACGDEAILLAFAIIGGIVFTSVILIVVYLCCLKHGIKQRETRDNACDCSRTRWSFGANGYVSRGNRLDRNDGGRFGDDEYEWGHYVGGGYNWGNYGDEEARRSLITAQVPRETMVRVHTPTGDVLC